MDYIILLLIIYLCIRIEIKQLPKSKPEPEPEPELKPITTGGTVESYIWDDEALYLDEKRELRLKKMRELNERNQIEDN